MSEQDDTGKVADTVDNLLHAMTLPLPDKLHLQALREALPSVRDRLRVIYVEQTGDDPWREGGR